MQRQTNDGKHAVPRFSLMGSRRNQNDSDEDEDDTQQIFSAPRPTLQPVSYTAPDGQSFSYHATSEQASELHARAMQFLWTPKAVESNTKPSQHTARGQPTLDYLNSPAKTTYPGARMETSTQPLTRSGENMQSDANRVEMAKPTNDQYQRNMISIGIIFTEVVQKQIYGYPLENSDGSLNEDAVRLFLDVANEQNSVKNEAMDKAVQEAEIRCQVKIHQIITERDAEIKDAALEIQSLQRAVYHLKQVADTTEFNHEKDVEELTVKFNDALTAGKYYQEALTRATRQLEMEQCRKKLEEIKAANVNTGPVACDENDDNKSDEKEMLQCLLAQSGR